MGMMRKIVTIPGPGGVVRGVCALAAALMLAQCDQVETETTGPTPATAPASSASDPVVVIGPPTPRAALTRADILTAASAAASAYAAGQPQSGESLVGRRFSVRIAFGCTGPAASEAAGAPDGLARWSWSRDGRAARLSMTPVDWTGSALAAAEPESPWEAVEGFWAPRPWMMSEDCPRLEGDSLSSDGTGVSPQTVALAAVFEKGGSRIGRRSGRAYAFTRRFEAGQTPSAPEDGYRLRLEGRLAAFPDGRAVRCQADNPDQRPVCVVAVALDRVAYEEASGALLSEWRPG
jgi:hypothetical protein